jgi:CopG family nickel-responsive transcriptional regulator
MNFSEYVPTGTPDHFRGYFLFSPRALKSSAVLEKTMQRVTMSLDDALAEAFDVLIAEQGYTSRSEAMRDQLRRAVEARRIEQAQGACVANLSFVYNHHIRALAQRLTEIAHDHHDLIVSTMHVHLDHENCLESTVLKGETARVRAFADSLRAERGVTFAELNLISVETGDTAHQSTAAHRHSGDGVHLTPLNAPGRLRG